MTDKPLTNRERSVRRHNVATLLAFVCLAWIFAATLVDTPALMAFNALAVLVMFAAIIVMFVTRNADEYIAAIWRSGTSVAFVITAAVFLFLPFFEGMYDGFMGAQRNQDIDLSASASLVLMGSFFLGSAWTRLRGTI